MPTASETEDEKTPASGSKRSRWSDALAVCAQRLKPALSAPARALGPYRTGLAKKPSRKYALIYLALALVVALGALTIGLLWPGGADDMEAEFDFASAHLSDVHQWPAAEPELPPSTPLAPLLAAHQPDNLAVLNLPEGASRVTRGGSTIVRFNRPMVSDVQVGQPAEGAPVLFDPPIDAEVRWLTRSALEIVPLDFPLTPRETQLSFDPELASLSGERLIDSLERVLVLDGSPRVVLSQRSRVEAGTPLPLHFDAPVSLAALRNELLVYENGGGRRTLPFVLRSGGVDEIGHRVDIRLRRALEPGARIGVALTPRYSQYPSLPTIFYQLAPRPQIEAFHCREGAVSAGQCATRDPSGGIVDIGPDLRLLASTRLAAETHSVSVRPRLPGLQVRLAPHGPAAGRLLTIGGEWEPDQVYEVRVRGLRTEEGRPVRDPVPIAVRSAGHAPSIAVAAGFSTFERDAPGVIPFRAIHPEPSRITYRAVDEGDELSALVSQGSYVRDGESFNVAPLAPDARPNRWARGRFAWRNEARGSSMAIVSFRADASSARARPRLRFVQSTDLGVTLRATRDELLVWVTSISSAEPIAGAQVVVADTDAVVVGRGRTDRDGVARLEIDGDPVQTTHSVLVQARDDRAVLLLDPRRAIRSGQVAANDRNGLTASGYTDRGAYRPGETVRANFVVRRLSGGRPQIERREAYFARLHAPDRSASVRTVRVEPSEYATVDATFSIPVGAELGRWRVELAETAAGESIGQSSFRVAEFRQPTFRVDVAAGVGTLYAGDQVAARASATYLFGAPVRHGELAWTLSATGVASHSARFGDYRFLPADAPRTTGTLAAARVPLQGVELPWTPNLALTSAVRTRVTLTAEVTDQAGHTHAATRQFTAYPARAEVGIRRGADWTTLGEELDLEAVLIDAADRPVEGERVELSFQREGWHTWWEWSEGSLSGSGGYQMRRDQRANVVHQCRVNTSDEPVHCTFRPARSGTYLLLARYMDAAGRVSVASRRVYVAGPSEHPDRDPPGSPIAVTPERNRWIVGETARLAFESPWERAQALITVEREGVMHVERREVSAGGQVVEIPVRDDMVPNVSIGVTLVKARTGAPEAEIDLHAPDLRFGRASITVRPAQGRLIVNLDAPSEARAGTRIPIDVRVTDEDGRPKRCEVALWAVDEGTLRMTGYQVPDVAGGLFRRTPAAFAWEDVRRSLVSRLAGGIDALPSGDGGAEGQAQAPLRVRERFEPTPLWLPHLTTDADGLARTELELPGRPTQYRIMVVALDASTRTGRASTQTTAEMPLVLRPALPEFVTTGDRVEAAAFLHNTSDRELEVEVQAEAVRAAPVEASTYTLAPHSEIRIARVFNAPRHGPVTLRFRANAGEIEALLEQDVPVVPRARLIRSYAMGRASGAHTIALSLPAGAIASASRGRLTVATHPFVGMASVVRALEESSWGDPSSLAATIIGMDAYAALGLGDSEGLGSRELRARVGPAVARLSSQVESGHPCLDEYELDQNAWLLFALGRARQRSWLESETAYNTLRERVRNLVPTAQEDLDRLDDLAFAVRVLHEQGESDLPTEFLYDRLARLDPSGRGDLAIATSSQPERATPLIVDEAGFLLASNANPPSTEPGAIGELATALVAATSVPGGAPHAGWLAGLLLAARPPHAVGLPWGSARESAEALSALAAYATRWHWRDNNAPPVRFDGRELNPIGRSRATSVFGLPLASVVGSEHRLEILADAGVPLYFALSGRYAMPLSEVDDTPRAVRGVALHRVYERRDGTPLRPGSEVELGELIRVRLFVHSESRAGERVGLRDPFPAGFEPVDAERADTARDSLAAIFGHGFDDAGVVDGRAQLAVRSLYRVEHRELASTEVRYFIQLATGLSEFTYALRASSVGRFHAPDAELMSLSDLGFVARSDRFWLRVAPR